MTTPDDNGLLVELDVPPGTDDKEVAKVISELTDHIDGLHRAYGGHGMHIKDIRVYEHPIVRGGQGRPGRDVAWLGWLMWILGALFVATIVWCVIREVAT